MAWWMADAFLQKRYAAGFKVGCAEGRARVDARALKFIEEHPDATAAELREFLRESRRRNGRQGAAA